MTHAPDSTAPRVFPVHPRLDRFYASAGSSGARERIEQCLLRGDGPAILLGAAGIGKTMLLDVIANDLTPDLRVVRIASTQLCTRRALLQSILHGLGAPYRDREEGELRLALAAELTDTTVAPAGNALLVDEAQSLPIRLLEELRLLSNTSIDGSPRLRLLLCGTHALDETFTSPELTAFNQRIAARCYLEPLSREEVNQYVRAHLAAAGGDPDTLFEPDAYEAIRLASDGIPRLINQVCDRAIVLAVGAAQDTIDGETIQRAWSDLHQLSAPWQAPESSRLAAGGEEGNASPTNGVVEFGVLDDELNELEGADDFASDPPPQAESASRDTPSIEGVWNADEGLRGLSSTEPSATPPQPEPEQVEANEPEECIAYAFPSPDITEPAIEPIGSADRDPNEPPQPAGEEDEGPLADDPFDEPFDEEEIVFDRFAELAAIAPTATVVTNQAEVEFSQMFGALAPAVEGLLEEVTGRIEGTEASTGLSVVNMGPGESNAETQSPEQAASTDATPRYEAEDVLIVEDEPAAEQSPETSASAQRQDYAQLFAKLRNS